MSTEPTHRGPHRLWSLFACVVILTAACSTDTGEPADTGDEPEPTAASPSVVTTTSSFDVPDPVRIGDVLGRCPTVFDVDFADAQIDLVFEADPTAPFLVCEESDGSVDLTRLEERAIQALLAMEATTFEEPLPWTDLELFDWFTATVDGIRFRDDIEQSFCCEPEGYINVQTSNLAALDTERWIDPATGAGLIDLVALLVHEARHAEGAVHTCPDGMNDETVAELGAWAVESILYRWYADHADLRFFDAADRPGYYAETAAFDADRILKTRFCGS